MALQRRGVWVFVLALCSQACAHRPHAGCRDSSCEQPAAQPAHDVLAPGTQPAETTPVASPEGPVFTKRGYPEPERGDGASVPGQPPLRLQAELVDGPDSCAPRVERTFASVRSITTGPPSLTCRFLVEEGDVNGLRLVVWGTLCEGPDPDHPERTLKADSTLIVEKYARPQQGHGTAHACSYRKRRRVLDGDVVELDEECSYAGIVLRRET